MIAIKKLIFALVAVCLFAFNGRAQTSVNVYPLNNAFGFKFNGDKKFSPEIRLDFQVDMVGGESNVYVNPELFGLFNFFREEQFVIYCGLGVGAAIYNQASNNFTCSLPLGASYFFGTQKRFGVLAECGLKVAPGAQVKLNSYALGGLVLRF
ncbi:MAG: hypothetical protein JXQ69_06020 [Paludibacteraceae bacterium]|nr:hypothetical protein [Paludibacteraceae bacterium]MBN2787867.1 hypothetical protein [Paludibacteraceae bacterium]